MKTPIFLILFFLSIVSNNSFAQNKPYTDLSSLVIYEVMFNDTLQLNSEKNAKELSNMIDTDHLFQKRYISDMEVNKFIAPLRSTNNFNKVIILNPYNKKVENKIEFEKCFLHYDTLNIEDNNTGTFSTKVFEYNYLDPSNLFILKFYEKWTIDEASININKEVLAYSISINKQTESQRMTFILFTVVSNKNALDYLNSNDYLK